MTLIPLSLQVSGIGYPLEENSPVISHLLFKNGSQIDSLAYTFYLCRKYIGIKLGISKCDV